MAGIDAAIGENPSIAIARKPASILRRLTPQHRPRAMTLSARCLFFLLIASPVIAADREARVAEFSPRGTVKDVRQVTARFSAPMVPIGDPRAVVNPFTIDCAPSGKGRWVDSRTWVFDFDKDLPAGVRCTFTVRDGLAALSGEPIGGERSFDFDTGGPAVRSSV